MLTLDLWLIMSNDIEYLYNGKYSIAFNISTELFIKSMVYYFIENKSEK